MQGTTSNYRWLDSDRIVETVQVLQGRVEGRFPGSGLSKVVAEVLRVAEEAVGRIRWIQKPHLPLRCAAVVLSLAIIGLVLLMLVRIPQFQFNDYTNFIQAIEASISSVVFIGAAILCSVSWENR